MSRAAPESPATRIDLAAEQAFSIGSLRVIPAERAVESNGARSELQPRVMQVLVALAQARPAVVSRERLIDRCWEGRVVGDDAVNRCILALRQMAAACEPPPFTIETIPRIGHRLVETRTAPLPAVAYVPPRRPRWLVVAAAALLVAAIAIGVVRYARTPAAPPEATIAVLPFRGLATDDSFFAEGLREEIVGQLARDPEIRVAGWASSDRFRGDVDARDVGRALRVNYVLEGSVRSGDGRVRVLASLIQSADGLSVWSDTFERSRDDMLAIQVAIGSAVTRAVRRNVAAPGKSSFPVATNGEAYRQYLVARGLLRTRDPKHQTAELTLLRDVIRLDPDFAPAWSSLAQALVHVPGTPDQFVETLPQIRDHARRALALAPDMAEAHATLGLVLGFATPEAQFHLQRAVELEPENAEFLIWRGIAHNMAGEFAEELASYQRAHELDPGWFRTIRDTANALTEFGRHDEAAAFVRRELATNEVNQNLLLGRLALVAGDFSETARRSLLASRTESAFRTVALQNLAVVREILSDPATRQERLFVAPGDLRSPTRRLWLTAAPTPAVWRAHNRDAVAAEVFRQIDSIGAKLMLNAGRVSELLATYDSPSGLLGLHAGSGLRPDQLSGAAIVAVALRSGGRSAEADALAHEAANVVASIRKRGAVPIEFEATDAAVESAASHADAAVRVLARAVERGWVHAGMSDLADLDDEPVFRALRPDPRFQAIVRGLREHYARERREVAQLDR